MGFLAKLAVKKTKKTARKNKAANDDSKYRGVEVTGQHAECCEEAKALAGRRFLSQEAPMLPLGGCSASDCRCHYEPFYDRRADIRRASDVGYDIASQFNKDCSRSRALPDRRRD